MKTEEFEDAIRQKIESVNPLYDENEIERVYDYVTKNRSTYPTPRLRNIILASVAGMVLLGLLFWNISLMNNAKEMEQKMETLETNLAQSESKAPVIKTDTVIVKEYVHDGTVHQLLTTSLVANYNEIKQGIKQEFNTTNKGRNNITSKQEKSPSNNEFIVSNGVSDSNKENTKTNTTNEAATVPTNTDIQSIKIGNGELNNQQDIKQNKQEEIIDPSEENQTESVAKQKTVLDTPNQVVKAHHNLFAFLKDWHYMAGILGEIANRQMGYGVKGQVFFNDNLSMNIGTNFVTLNNQSYNDNDDYRNREGQDFQTVYHRYVSDTSLLSNISIRINILQIPISFSYHLPLLYKFEGMLGIGTDIDLIAAQDIDYRHHKDINTIEEEGFVVDYKAMPFNNLVFTAGLERRWKHLCFQLQSFISPQSKAVAYKKENLYYGSQLNIAWAFYK